jgi:hypothetical protein
MKKLVPIPPENLKRLKKDDVKDFGYQFVSVRLKDGRVFAQAVAHPLRTLPYQDNGILRDSKRAQRCSA